jgi:hypothetical protein
MASSQVPVVSSEANSFDRTTEYTRRIADLEDWLKAMKQKIITSMIQAEKSAALSQKVSSLEEHISALMAKVIQLEECDMYMTEIVEEVSEQLQCKSL